MGRIHANGAHKTYTRDISYLIYSTAVAIVFGLLFLRGVFHDSIPLLYFLSPGSQLEFRKWRCVPRLERRNGLEEMAPMIATYHETSPSIASSHRGEGASLHIDDPTPPSPCPFRRSSFLTRQSRLYRLGNG